MFTDTQSVSKTKHNLTYRMGHANSSPNTDEFYRFYISQGNVGMFSNHFITNLPQNAPVKKIENRSTFSNDMVKILWLTFWATLYTRSYRLSLL